ncbi:hypothetical protein BRADI_1g58011v3 [Brachypodium distachyon]|uniref:Uncharacterized protein n=1 Tax=Brachypodium distachyon TaxID=15368 RepID=A0A0Q3HDX9_BRADI|nr:hypothetical protein BRADI_1g58011v3 [Brachypodium distachyon]
MRRLPSTPASAPAGTTTTTTRQWWSLAWLVWPPTQRPRPPSPDRHHRRRCASAGFSFRRSRSRTPPRRLLDAPPSPVSPLQLLPDMSDVDLVADLFSAASLITPASDHMLSVRLLCRACCSQLLRSLLL